MKVTHTQQINGLLACEVLIVEIEDKIYGVSEVDICNVGEPYISSIKKHIKIKKQGVIQAGDKILISPEQFPSDHNLKVGDKCFVECALYCTHGYFPIEYQNPKQIIKEGAGGHICSGEYRIKLTYGLVTIIQEEKKMYTREEVKEISIAWARYCRSTSVLEGYVFDDWFKTKR